MEGVSICITAYDAQDYIKECLDSVVNQSWFKTHNNWEIIVGVDGCEKTLNYLKDIMHLYKNLRVFMMDSNKGTYITSNTIISNATYEHIFRFDSDDIMCSNLVETVLTKKSNCQYIRYYLRNFGNDTSSGVAWGPIYISKTLFTKYGGYKPWPCGADSDLYYRLKNNETIKTIRDVLMLRRVHSTSLTQSKETGMKSELRKKYASMIKKDCPQSEAIIDCVKNTYKEVFSSLDGPVNKDEYMKNVKETYDTCKNTSTLNSSKEIVTQVKSPEIRLNKKAAAIKKLREDINAGKIIQVPTINGFIWKRVK